MTTHRDVLRRAGVALYGPRWQSDLARALGVQVRTVQRWDAGSTTPSAGVFHDLRALCRSRAVELAALDGALRAAEAALLECLTIRVNPPAA